LHAHADHHEARPRWRAINDLLDDAGKIGEDDAN